MKRFTFDGQKGLIVVKARLWGPTGDTRLRLALDTGATSTMISTAVLVSIGYDPSVAVERVRVTTASTVEYVPCLTAQQIEALGQRRLDFPLLCHTLPPTTTIDGLLGLDFLRDQYLTVNFPEGFVEIE